MPAYATQRARLVEAMPPLDGILPQNEPGQPDVRPLSRAEIAQQLAEAANNQASLMLILGWGDGSVPRALLDDPLCRQKHLVIILFAGEEDAFARSLAGTDAIPWSDGNLRICIVRERADLQRLIVTNFNQHHDLPALAGADLVERHPLTPAAEALRSAVLPELHTLLADRPQAYGNDIIDSFMGLDHASSNARLILPAPTIGEMKGFFGATPIISIAAGPSVKRHLDQLRRLQDRCILVACDAVLHGLLDAGIDPHFVTPLERVDLIKPMLTRAGESRSIYAGLPVCPPEAVAAFGEGRTIGLSCGDRLYDWLTPEPTLRINTGLSTGTLSVSVACALGTGPVYLVGHDLAKDENASHWDGAGYAGNDWKRVKTSVEEDAPVLSGYEDRRIPGNGGGLVQSIAWWDRFRYDIAHEAGLMRAAGRVLHNVNAHDRIFAHIDHTGSDPLPDPDSLPPLAPWRLPERKPERYDSWAARARLLPEDSVLFRAHLADLQRDLATAKAGPPSGWDPAPFADRLDLTAAVSPGNRMAFAYVLRSAMHNSNAEMHLRRRTASASRSRWLILESMQDLCSALDGALTTLHPELERIAREHS